jgi:hypothetical protein
MERMREYDAVSIPISFGDDLRYLTEFNIATKMGKCLASGIGTVVYGPPYLAMVRYLSGTGAVLITSEEPISSWSKIVKTIKNPEWRGQISRAACKLVREKLATDVMRGRWCRAVEHLNNASSK